MFELITNFLDIIVYLIGLIGILVIIWGVARGSYMFVVKKTFWQIRLVLVKHILLGLDFLIARDIIETVILKTDRALWLDLAALVLIIIIRVVFSYFTSKEMEQIEGKHGLKKL